MSRFFLAPVFAALALSACVGAPEGPLVDTDPLDPEVGLITQEARGRFGEDSPEAARILAFVNQPLADADAAEAFFELLDSRLHKRAARNIVIFREQGEFLTLRQLDRVKYVGPVAMERLLELARAHVPAVEVEAIDCAPALPQERGGAYHLTRLADLAAIRDADCTDIYGDVVVHFREGVYLPPWARSLQPLDAIRRIHGSLTIADNTALYGLSFDALESVGDLTIANNDGMRRLTGFPVLREAGHVNIEINTAIHVNSPLERLSGFALLERAASISVSAYKVAELRPFPTLRTVHGHVSVRTSSVNPRTCRQRPCQNQLTIGGFAQLVEVGGRLLIDDADTDLRLTAFERLERAGSIELLGEQFGGNGNWHDGSKLDAGEAFELLTEVGDVTIRGWHRMDDVSFDSLEHVAGSVRIEDTDDNDGAELFPALTSVGRNVAVVAGLSSTPPFPGRRTLERVDGELRAEIRPQTSGGTYRLPDALESAGSIVLRMLDAGRLMGLSGVEEAGAVSLDGGHWEVDFDVLRNLEVVGHLTIPRFRGETFDALSSLHTVEHDLRIALLSHRTRSLRGLGRLRHVGGDARLWLVHSLPTRSFLPRLASVAGDLQIHQQRIGDATFRGLDGLTSVSGDLRFATEGTFGSPDLSLQGLRRLRAVGGDMVLSQYLEDWDVDRLLAQVTDFAGDITRP